ncbi:type II secretion system F family protein, partial [Acidithiobacillus sp.]|uniref:type II secretion system F family protein n=1 Tax=Acidithiobacillus sp. TaxID=1872118 RepID=UPI003D03F3FE
HRSGQSVCPGWRRLICSREKCVSSGGVTLTEVRSLVSALIQTEERGGDLGPVLRAQAEQRREERFLRAEKLALEAPVKLLAPLVVFIFPITFLMLAFVIYMKFIQEGGF